MSRFQIRSALCAILASTLLYPCLTVATDLSVLQQQGDQAWNASECGTVLEKYGEVDRVSPLSEGRLERVAFCEMQEASQSPPGNARSEAIARSEAALARLSADRRQGKLMLSVAETLKQLREAPTTR